MMLVPHSFRSPRIGTLLPLHSLVSTKTNSLFSAAEVFIDWLAKTRQSIWQLLPLHPTTWLHAHAHFDSPYSSYGVGLNPQLLSKKEQREVDTKKDFESFFKKNAYWLDDYALFIALSIEFQTDDWLTWPAALRERHPTALLQAKERHRELLAHICLQQATLHDHYSHIAKYAKGAGIEIWGDIPFYLPQRSPLVWKYQNAFLVNEHGQTQYVAGSIGGRHFHHRQSWGFPLYRFDEGDSLTQIRELWELRLRYAAELYPRVRLDSATRFFVYEKMHISDPSLDQQQTGPGDELFTPLIEYARKLGLEVYVEDIANTDLSPLQEALERLHIPGVSVASMMLDGENDTIDPNFFNVFMLGGEHVFFTSTHDTAPLLSFIESLTKVQQDAVCQHLGIHATTAPAITREIRDLLLTKAKITIVALQDWILSKDRINTPGIENGINWNYYMTVPVEELPDFTESVRPRTPVSS